MFSKKQYIFIFLYFTALIIQRFVENIDLFTISPLKKQYNHKAAGQVLAPQP